MGDEVKFAPGQRLFARFPVRCHIRLMSGGKALAEKTGDRFAHVSPRPAFIASRAGSTSRENGDLGVNPT